MGKITLVVGDWSGDGHGKVDTFTFSVNCTQEELEQAYKKGVALTGISLKEICCEYGDSKMPYENYEKLKEIGMESKGEDVDEDWGAYVSTTLFAEAYLIIAKQGFPHLEYAPCSTPSINIGGYGIFD